MESKQQTQRVLSDEGRAASQNTFLYGVDGNSLSLRFLRRCIDLANVKMVMFVPIFFISNLLSGPSHDDVLTSGCKDAVPSQCVGDGLRELALILYGVFRQ